MANIGAGTGNSLDLANPGTLSATSTIRGGNILSAGLVSVAGNVTGGNLNTAGLLSVAGNQFKKYNTKRTTITGCLSIKFGSRSTTLTGNKPTDQKKVARGPLLLLSGEELDFDLGPVALFGGGNFCTCHLDFTALGNASFFGQFVGHSIASIT